MELASKNAQLRKTVNQWPETSSIHTCCCSLLTWEKSVQDCPGLQEAFINSVCQIVELSVSKVLQEDFVAVRRCTCRPAAAEQAVVSKVRTVSKRKIHRTICHARILCRWASAFHMARYVFSRPRGACDVSVRPAEISGTFWNCKMVHAHECVSHCVEES